MKKCCKCHQVKSLSDFQLDNSRKDKKQTACRLCSTAYRKKLRESSLENKQKAKDAANNSRRIKNYGIDKYDYMLMLAKQKFSCAGCLKHHSMFKKSLAVDHCHTTGKVRGLLCDGCNRVLGFVQDSIETLKRLGDYLDNTR